MTVKCKVSQQYKPPEPIPDHPGLPLGYSKLPKNIYTYMFEITGCPNFDPTDVGIMDILNTLCSAIQEEA
jgi:hypothetical protein